VQAPEPVDAARNAIRHWSRLPELAEFAARRHGFGDSDGGFGVTYSGDLDDFDRANGEFIPEGFVQVYGFWGPPDGYEMLEIAVSIVAELIACRNDAKSDAARHTGSRKTL
jgi:hypothetical protein